MRLSSQGKEGMLTSMEEASADSQPTHVHFEFGKFYAIYSL
jgi:hypothetical protein